MVRLLIAAAFCFSSVGFASQAFAEPVTGTVVERASGDQIDGECSGKVRGA